MTNNVRSVCFMSNIVCYTMRLIAPIKLYTVNDQLNLGLLRLMSSIKINTSVKNLREYFHPQSVDLRLQITTVALQFCH